MNWGEPLIVGICVFHATCLLSIVLWRKYSNTLSFIFAALGWLSLPISSFIEIIHFFFLSFFNEEKLALNSTMNTNTISSTVRIRSPPCLCRPTPQRAGSRQLGVSLFPILVLLYCLISAPQTAVDGAVL